MHCTTSADWTGYEVHDRIKLDRTIPIYPICSSGADRSWIVHELLKRANYPVEAAHGAESGYDPYPVGVTQLAKNAGRYAFSAADPKIFFKGASRHARRCWNGVDRDFLGIIKGANPGRDVPDATELRAWFDEHYWGKILREGGQLICLGQRAVEISRARLEEVAAKEGFNLERVTLHAIRMDSPLARGKRGVRAYHHRIRQLFSLKYEDKLVQSCSNRR